MPFVVRSDSENENEAELVFLSPDEEPVKKPTAADQGASPVLRRSNRKRKSTASFCDSDMSKNSGSKKKKNSPGRPQDSSDPGKSMPRIPRTPQQEQQQAQDQAPQAQPPTPGDQRINPIDTFERYLSGMEDRLVKKMDATNKAVNEAVGLAKATKESLDALEEKVDSNEVSFKTALQDVEARMLARMEETLKVMVDDQLRAAGFDPDLTASGLSTINRTPACKTPSYAAVLTENGTAAAFSKSEKTKLDRSERQEDAFWDCRRSLRLWPVPGADRPALLEYLRTKTRMDEDFINNDLGEVSIKQYRDPKSKVANEVIVKFETKEVRDMIKANASNLANFRDEAGMRLHLPNHLQKDFKALMGLSYDLKKKHSDLKRNVKFDESDLGLFMDIQLTRDGSWKRVKPEQARKAAAASGVKRNGGPDELAAEELTDLLGSVTE